MKSPYSQLFLFYENNSIPLFLFSIEVHIVPRLEEDNKLLKKHKPSTSHPTKKWNQSNPLHDKYPEKRKDILIQNQVTNKRIWLVSFSLSAHSKHFFILRNYLRILSRNFNQFQLFFVYLDNIGSKHGIWFSSFLLWRWRRRSTPSIYSMCCAMLLQWFFLIASHLSLHSIISYLDFF